MNSIKKKTMFSSLLFTVAIILLADPGISFIDLLPDAVAYLLIVIALTPLSAVVPHFAEARERFQKLIILAAVRIPVTAVAIQILSNNTHQLPLIVVFSVVFAAFDIIFLLPAIRELFEGIYMLATRFEIEEGRGDAHISLVGMRMFTEAFILLRAVLMVAPSLSLLSISYDELSNKPAGVTVGQFAFFALMATVVLLVVGIIWAVKFIPYIRAVSLACDTSPVLKERCEGMRDTLTAVTERRKVSFLMLLLAGAALSSADVWLDNVNYLPDAVTGICILLFCVFLYRTRYATRKHIILPIIAASLYILTDIAAYVVNILFTSSYTHDNFHRTKMADLLYGIWGGITVAEAVCGVLMLLVLVPALLQLIRCASGRYRFDGSLDTEDWGVLRMRCGLMTAAGILAVAFDPIEHFLRWITEDVAANPDVIQKGEVTIQPMGGMWILSLVLSLLYFVLCLYFTYGVKESSHTRFPL